MPTEKRNGPKLTIVADCFGCEHVRGEEYCVEDGNDCDSGTLVYCAQSEAVFLNPDPTASGLRRIGDTTWTTPT